MKRNDIQDKQGFLGRFLLNFLFDWSASKEGVRAAKRPVVQLFGGMPAWQTDAAVQELEYSHSLLQFGHIKTLLSRVADY